MTNVLSLGLGVQSTALYFMSAMGELPRIDYAVFADPGKERKGTIKYLDFLLNWAEKHKGPQIIVKSDRNLFRDLLNNTNNRGDSFASVPAFTRNDDGTQGMLRRQCTNEYKIAVVDKAIREKYELVPRQRCPETFVWKGLSLEELSRLSNPEVKWKVFIHPFIGYGTTKKGYFKLAEGLTRQMNRGDLRKWYKAHDLPIPPKSACVFCPYQSDSRWADMKVNEPEDFAAAVEVDNAIRDSSKRGVEQPIFLHPSLKPLNEVNFDPHSRIEWGECSGTCGT